MKTIASTLKELSFFKGMSEEHLKALAECAKNVQFKTGEVIFKEGDESNWFYVLKSGKVAIEVNVVGRGGMIIQTISEGDVLSWSWIVPPYKKHFGARAMQLTRAIAFDGVCVRNKCEQDHSLGYELFKRFAVIISQRLDATRLQLIDMYGGKK
jgi:CRP-like cAMP-binding protein